eukprot:g15905.t1
MASSGAGSVEKVLISLNAFSLSEEDVTALQSKLNKCTGHYYWKEGDDYCQGNTVPSRTLPSEREPCTVTETPPGELYSISNPVLSLSLGLFEAG